MGGITVDEEENLFFADFAGKVGMCEYNYGYPKCEILYSNAIFLGNPYSLELDGQGNLLIGSTGGRIHKCPASKKKSGGCGDAGGCFDQWCTLVTQQPQGRNVRAIAMESSGNYLYLSDYPSIVYRCVDQGTQSATCTEIKDIGDT